MGSKNFCGIPGPPVDSGFTRANGHSSIPHAAITEAIMESRSAPAQKALTSGDVHRWLIENADGNTSVTDTSPDVRMRTVRGAGWVTFDTVYRGEEQILHRNVISLG